MEFVGLLTVSALALLVLYVLLQAKDIKRVEKSVWQQAEFASERRKDIVSIFSAEIDKLQAAVVAATDLANRAASKDTPTWEALQAMRDEIRSDINAADAQIRLDLGVKDCCVAWTLAQGLHAAGHSGVARAFGQVASAQAAALLDAGVDADLLPEKVVEYARAFTSR